MNKSWICWICFFSSGATEYIFLEARPFAPDKAQEDIVSYLNNVGYFVYGPCGRDSELEEQGYSSPVGYEGQGLTNKKYKYCVSTRNSNTDTLDRKYYKVTVFFKFDIPILDSIFTFPVTGETKAVYFAKD